MNQSNDNYKQFISIIILTLFIAGCGGGGGGDDIVVDTNQMPVAIAGDDFLVSRNFNVDLDGSGSSDADGDSLTFTWTQIAGPDVTGGTGILTGESPVFQAPSEVSTLIFELVVNDGQEDSAVDTMGINVLEDENAAYYVDGDNGSDDTGNGSVEMPYASIAKALCEVTQVQQDIYVKTLDNDGIYDETVDPCPGEPARSADKILAIPTGTSLYGGYDGDGIRDQVNNPTLVATSHHGFIFTAVNLNAWFTGFNVASDNSPGPESSVYALSVLGGSASIVIHDNRLIAGDVPLGNATSPGTSYALRVALIESASIERNVISAGFGGNGLDVGNTFSTAATRGQDGAAATGRSAGAGGDGKGAEDYDGGSGGGGGAWTGFCAGGSSYGSAGAVGQGSRGGAGGARGSSCGASGSAGGPGGAGNNGAIGSGGNGSGGMDVYEDGGYFASYTIGNGSKGNTGEAGHGGGGGGGGRGNWVDNAGGGGGGGGGGSGGAGGPGGGGGGASIGLFIATVNTAVINNNNIASGTGGNGAAGGQGQIGGDGGAGGDGAEASAGNGGNGSIGGKGGNGGRGGAGGGGPSYGIFIGYLTGPTVTDNDISAGDGGLGGDGGNGGNGGDGGNSYAVYDNYIADGIVPALTNNTSSFSVPGEGGGTTGTGGSSGATGGSGVINW